VRHSLTLNPGPLDRDFVASTHAAAKAAAGLFRRDPSVWSSETPVQEAIANRLGWLSSPLLMADSIERLEAFGAKVKADGFEHVVLLGMGGSSLAPEVLRAVLGVSHGAPTFQVLDSTDPAALLSVNVPLAKSLFVIASKSGTTIEPDSLAAYFGQDLVNAGIRRWADHFVAITDEGTALASRAAAKGFRETFINPSDIGGRYSALSYFGLVPAALMGHDLAALIGWALAMLAAADAHDEDAAPNPAVGLGAILGAAALAGQDKLTLLLPVGLEPLGLWIEQLVAESTGKAGVGIVPIVGETPGGPTAYAGDRQFVQVRLSDMPDPTCDATVAELRRNNAPLAILEMQDLTALGAEFVRWEIATAVAGAMLGIDPFDQPNVQQAKDATGKLLSRYHFEGRLPEPVADQTTAEGVTLSMTESAREALQGQGADALLTLVGPGDYIAILAYLGPDPDLAASLHAFRMSARDRTGAATTFGYGPRYLHSTGQLHKGGPNTGVFVIVTADPRVDLPIPGKGTSFGTLELAQALGDFASLDVAARRALHVHLPVPERALLQPVLDGLLDRVDRSP
jgi:glucose-6-phosphate isomerase